MAWHGAHGSLGCIYYRQRTVARRGRMAGVRWVQRGSEATGQGYNPRRQLLRFSVGVQRGARYGGHGMGYFGCGRGVGNGQSSTQCTSVVRYASATQAPETSQSNTNTLTLYWFTLYGYPVPSPARYPPAR